MSESKLVSLQIARRARKLSLSEVASYTKISEARLALFEEGKADPSILQLSRLGELYNTPFYTFFSEDLELDSVLPDFRRTVPTSASLSPRGLSRIWQTERRLKFTEEVRASLGKSGPKTRTFSRLTNRTIPSAAELRVGFDDWLGRRSGLARLGDGLEDRFTRQIRLFLEIHSCQTSFNSAPISDYLGFFDCSDRGSGVVFVNRDIKNDRRKLFTLCHEMAHFVHGEEGVSDPLRVSRNSVETLCNNYAAEFIAPEDTVEKIVKSARRADISDPERLITLVSRNTFLSRQASAIRLRELKFITKAQSSTYFKKLSGLRQIAETPSSKERSPMGAAAAIGRAVSEIGVFSCYIAKLAFDKKIIDRVDIERGLGLSEILQDRVFDLSAKRFEASSD